MTKNYLFSLQLPIKMSEQEEPSNSLLENEGSIAFENVVIDKTETLGTGSFGAVCKAKCDELPCAAKLLYPVLFDLSPTSIKQHSPRQSTKEHRQPVKRFEQECKFLSQIKHPNIVQYLGTFSDPDTKAPVLIMELMDESLTNFLHSAAEPVPYNLQVDITHDIAIALAYLHSNNIIHRDLSSNNVLLLAGRRAKVSDFGMSTLIQQSSKVSSLTTCPGTPAYMPPEALNEPPVYTMKLDSFSLGVIIVQILTRIYPKPTERYIDVQVPDPRNHRRNTTAKIPVPEVERRQQHIEMIEKDHPLLSMALDCLKDQDSDRPCTKDICYSMEAIKQAQQYIESSEENRHIKRRDVVENGFDQGTLVANGDDLLADQHDLHESEVKLLRDELDQVTQELQAKDALIDIRQKQLTRLKIKLKDQERENETLSGELMRKTARIRELEKRLQTLIVNSPPPPRPPASTSSLRLTHTQSVPAPTREVPSTRAAVSLLARCSSPQFVRRCDSNSLERRPLPSLPPLEMNESLNFNWKKGPLIPTTMRAGSSAVDDSFFYCCYESELFAFSWKKEAWVRLTDCPNKGSRLVMVRDILTAIGGSQPITNKIYSYTGMKWESIFPPMKSARCGMAVASNNNVLVVAGGKWEWDRLTTVEVMDISTRTWTEVASLPYPLSHGNATICKGTLYIIGGEDQITSTKSILKCNLSQLLESKPKTKKIWDTTCAELPMTHASCSSFRDQLLVVGGKDSSNGQPISTIQVYNAKSDSWTAVGKMSTGRSHCLTGVHHNTLLIVGGINQSGVSSTTEIATLVMKSRTVTL